MSMTIRAAAFAVLCLAGTSGFAAGDVERGREKSQICQACHGEDGNGVGDPQYPIIAGQYTDYLEHALRAYKTGERQNLIMQGFADALDDDDIEDLAAYYSQQSSRLDDLSHIK